MIENKEWNAFAMGNYSIYVFTGLLNDMDDDEVAIVLGHELVHATHEHTRKEFKRAMSSSSVALGVLGASIDDRRRQEARGRPARDRARRASAYTSGYGRGMEDQADRVGLRYAYEAGYDITKGPRLWNRFAKKYGEGNKVVNFFFGDHSQSAARATKLEKEIAFNYPDGPKPGGPARKARHGAAAPRRPRCRRRRSRPLPGLASQALVAGRVAPARRSPRPAAAAAAPARTRTEIKSGHDGSTRCARPSASRRPRWSSARRRAGPTRTSRRVREGRASPTCVLRRGGRTRLAAVATVAFGGAAGVLRPELAACATSAPAVSTFTSLSM